jgi:hypothetical protein
MPSLFRFPGIAASAASATGAVKKTLSSTFDASGTGTFEAFGVDTNAGTARITRGADLTGNADVPNFFFSMWIRPVTISSGNIYSTGANEILLGLTGATGQFLIVAENAAGTSILNSRSPASSVTASVIQHWCGSVAMGTLNSIWMRKNGVTQTQTTSVFAVAPEDLNINFTVGNHSIGANPSGGAAYNGAIAEVWIDHQFIANTDANVLKFISNVSGTGVPIDLGPTGTLPGFGAPIMYFSRRGSGTTVASFATNLGTGLGFTQQNTLLDGGSFGGA